MKFEESFIIVISAAALLIDFGTFFQFPGSTGYVHNGEADGLNTSAGGSQTRWDEALFVIGALVIRTRD